MLPHPDDEPVPMTAVERTVWAALAAVVVATAAYAAVIVPRLLSTPVAGISWVAPMLWTIGLAVPAAIVFAVALAAAVAARHPRSTMDAGVVSDVRDREIGAHGGRACTGVLSAGLGAGLLLTMLGADPFWTGNALFLAGVAGAVTEGVTKLRLYRLGR